MKGINNVKIEDVISQRLKMQSTQKVLENEFGIKDFSRTAVINFISNLKDMQEVKKQKFIITIGGAANFKKTESFINNL